MLSQKEKEEEVVDVEGLEVAEEDLEDEEGLGEEEVEEVDLEVGEEAVDTVVVVEEDSEVINASHYSFLHAFHCGFSSCTKLKPSNTVLKLQQLRHILVPCLTTFF